MAKWTPAESKAFTKAVSKARSFDEALVLVRQACPGKEITRPLIDNRLRRLGLHTLGQIVAANQGARNKDDAAREISDFALIAKKGGTLEEVCDRLNWSPKKVRSMLEAAKAAGYRLELRKGEIGYVPQAENVNDVKKIIAPPTETQTFAVISDLHIGSKYCLEDQLVDFVTRAVKEDGVTQFFGPGDNLDGCYRHSRWEESHHGFDAQATRFAKILPKFPGVRYDMIAGNHDETFEKDSGLDVCRATEDVFRREGRDDFHMHGARGAYLRFAPKGGRGALIELWHPLGGGSYAVSYKLQRHVEEYGVGRKPDFLFCGHFHQQCYIVRRGVHCFLSGTFHGEGSSFGKALGGSQAIGGWIVNYAQTKDGTIRDVSTKWRGYYQAEGVRSLGLT